MGCDIHAMMEVQGEYCWRNAGDPDLNRDYELFAVLAGVRNHLGLNPISEPRGVPDNACSAFRAWHTRYDSDAHSASFVTLAELKAFDRDQEVDDDHLVKSRDESGRITGTCASTNGPHLGVVGRRKVFGTWGSGHYDDLIAKMERARPEGASDTDVRLLFFFDN